MKKVIVIIGPTASGKTKIGVELAKRLNTEVISGDSVQVYKKLNIGSAKVTSKEMEGVKHHLIDILELDEDYSVCEFQKQARLLIDELSIPLIVGGTGLYIKAALSNYEFDAPKRDKAFELSYKEVSNEEIYKELLKLDPKACEVIHPNNRHRALRALYAAKNNQPLSSKNKKDEMLYEAYIIYLDMPRDLLYERINKRVDMMFEEGLEAEVRNIYRDHTLPHAIGYQEFLPYFNGEISLEEVKEDIKKNSRHLAKRQITWFKNQMDTHFYEVDLTNIENTINKIYADVLVFLKEVR